MLVFQADSFTDKPFLGNPAAVCILNEEKDDRLLQNIAMEMNLSETAFIRKCSHDFNLRWFTPKTEVDLCGHATLAAAHILWEQGFLPSDREARFFTRSGLLTARLSQGWIELNFPAERERETTPPKDLVEALGVQIKYIGRNRFDYLVEVESEEIVRNLQPNFALLQKVTDRGVIVTSLSKDYDFISRFFAPAVGIDEDPVTGSAHCCLGPFWKSRLAKGELIGFQASARGGIVRTRVTDERVYLLGQVVTVLKGELLNI